MSRDRATRNQLDIKREAVERANARMRAEILPEALGASPVSETNQALLAAEWNPWTLDPGEGFDATLRTTDALVLAVMKDRGLLSRARSILSEEMARAMLASRQTPALLKAVLEDLLNGPKRPLYEAEA
jgi:hypothetical protein